MRLSFKTKVDSSYESVISRFDQNLLLSLLPPGVKMSVKRFDGMKPGDKMDFSIHSFGLSFRWVGQIGMAHLGENIWAFTDTGLTLPAGLKTWKHLHAVIRQNGSIFIYDRVSWTGKKNYISLIWFIPVYIMLAIRKPRYKKYFQHE